MANTRFDRTVLLLVLAAGLSGLVGCASDPRHKQGVEWVVSDEAQKKRLNDAGFPQYNSGL